MKRLLLVELNELNFEMVERYVAQGRLPNFGALLAQHGYVLTSSETDQEDIEPWIQWVTAHTGKRLADHKVRRLGDIVETDEVQIWELLEARGLRVGAFSPMNAKHRMKQPAFFVPDPWTGTEVSAPPLVARLHAAIAQVVNDNAEARISAGSLFSLALGALRYASPANYAEYLRLAALSVRKPWLRAVFLDLLMADVFSDLCRRKRVDFASVFFNAAAHIQHHYMHSSAVADSPARNPDWYCRPGEDPVYDVYRAYDRIVGALQRRFPDYRLLLATGLHQVCHQAPTFYWRVKDHGRFLAELGVIPARVSPRMSRDFVVEFDSEADAVEAERKLLSVKAAGCGVFEVDNRGRSLFVTLVYSHDVPADLELTAGNDVIPRFREQIAFVAIKNGEHDGHGYLLDTGSFGDPSREALPLEKLPERIFEAFA